MSLRKVMSFVHEIDTILYVGGGLSHIVIGTVLGREVVSTALDVSNYKEMSMHILILPDLALKTISDAVVYF